MRRDMPAYVEVRGALVASKPRTPNRVQTTGQVRDDDDDQHLQRTKERVLRFPCKYKPPRTIDRPPERTGRRFLYV